MPADTASHGVNLLAPVILLASAVIAVPLFRRLGLDSVLGYLAAGLVIGPFGLGLFTDPQSIIHVAELGVVMFLFVIGLEMQPSRLWGLRKEILGVGLVQVLLCAALTTAAGISLGYSPAVAFVFGSGFVLTSTAIVMQILGERKELSSPKGQRIVSILLLEDLAIVPLLAIMAFLAPGGAGADHGSRWAEIAAALGSVAGLVLVGRYLLNPMFRILGDIGAREVMTAAALLVVLGSALAMQFGGLSMAMGAFLAGVMLSESAFRRQLEADIEPFRGLLLGLFFLGVGMALDLAVIAGNATLIATAVLALMIVKGLGIYAVARLLKSDHDEAVERATLMAQGGEFAFVLYAAAASSELISTETNAVFTSTVIISMVLTPFVSMAARALRRRVPQAVEGAETPDGLNGSVLIIGFGRFGQMVSQPLVARGFDVSIIDTDVEMIEVAAEFGFKVYYGDGSRLDILRAAGADKARILMVCVDSAQTGIKIAELMHGEFPDVPVMARAYDRVAALSLIEAGVAWQIRETLESAFTFGREGLDRLDVPGREAEAIMREVRRRDDQRLELQVSDGLNAGRHLFHPKKLVPAPLTTPRQLGQAGNEQTNALLSARKMPASDDHHDPRPGQKPPP